MADRKGAYLKLQKSLASSNRNLSRDYIDFGFWMLLQVYVSDYFVMLVTNLSYSKSHELHYYITGIFQSHFHKVTNTTDSRYKRQKTTKFSKILLFYSGFLDQYFLKFRYRALPVLMMVFRFWKCSVNALITESDASFSCSRSLVLLIR